MIPPWTTTTTTPRTRARMVPPQTPSLASPCRCRRGDELAEHAMSAVERRSSVTGSSPAHTAQCTAMVRLTPL